MKKLILPFVLGAVLVSCSRDNDDTATLTPTNPTTPTETPVLLTKLVNVESNGDVEVTNFEYDGDKLVKIYSGYVGGSWSNENVYNYTGDLITSITGKSSNNEGEKTTFEYDGQNRLKLVTSVLKNNHRVYTVTRNYTHNANGIVVVKEVQEIDYVNPASNDEREERTITYTLSSDGSIIKQEKNNNGVITTATYTYDNKNSSFNNVRGIKEAIFEFWEEGVVSASLHNITSYTEGADTETYEYEYNDKNYPKKATATNPQGDKETYEFTYNK